MATSSSVDLSQWRSIVCAGGTFTVAEGKTVLTGSTGGQIIGGLVAEAYERVGKDGTLTVAEGKTMTDEQLNKMNYYLQGVVSKIPNN